MPMLPYSPLLEVVDGLRPEFIEELERCQWSVDFLHELALHSAWTYEHSLRTGYVTARLVEEYNGRNTKQTLLVLRAGIFHDIGKLAIPTTILDGGELEGWQRKMLDAHPRIGFELLKAVDKDAAKIMVTHHEYQTRAYPRKTKRRAHDRLHHGRTSLALADGVDALLNVRPYKPAWSAGRVLAYLQKGYPEAQVIAALEHNQALAVE